MKLAHLHFSRLRRKWAAYDDQDGELIIEHANKDFVIRFCERLGYETRETTR